MSNELIMSRQFYIQLLQVLQRDGREATADVLPPPLLCAQAGQEVGVSAGEKQLH